VDDAKCIAVVGWLDDGSVANAFTPGFYAGIKGAAIASPPSTRTEKWRLPVVGHAAVRFTA
jgi:hypothetical protein